MIVIPVKTNSEQGVLAPLFGKAKFFALIDDQGKVTIHPNAKEGGVRVAHWLKSMGATALIANHLGEKPFYALLKEGIKIYCAGNERMDIHEAFARYKENAFEEVNMMNYMRLLGEGHEEHSHEHHDHTHHTHEKERCCDSKGHAKKGHHETCGGHGHKHHEKGACHKDH